MLIFKSNFRSIACILNLINCDVSCSYPLAICFRYLNDNPLPCNCSSRWIQEIQRNQNHLLGSAEDLKCLESNVELRTLRTANLRGCGERIN